MKLIFVIFIISFLISCGEQNFVIVEDSNIYYNDTIINTLGRDTIKISPYQREREEEMPYAYLLLKIFSIYPERVPKDYHYYDSPVSLYYSVFDTLKGAFYTQYIPKYYTEDFFNDFQIPQTYYFGFSYSAYHDTMFVVRVFQNTPAEKAGLKRGDQILKIDQYPINSNFNLYKEIVKDNNKTYTFIIKRDSLLDTLEMKKENISLPLVYYEKITNNIGYIYLSTFIGTESVNGKSSSKEVYDALDSLKECEYIIFDLRNNGGGFINEALEICRFFLKDNDTINLVLEREQKIDNDLEGRWEKYYNIVKGDGDYSNKKLFVLENGNSASASEIVIGALKYNKRAVIIGENSFGKAIGQSIFEAKNGGVAKISSFMFSFPNDSTYAHVGISPDIKVEDKIENFQDYMLLYTVNYIENNIIVAKKDESSSLVKSDIEKYVPYNELLWEYSKNIVPYPEGGIRKVIFGQ